MNRVVPANFIVSNAFVLRLVTTAKKFIGVNVITKSFSFWELLGFLFFFLNRLLFNLLLFAPLSFLLVFLLILLSGASGRTGAFLIILILNAPDDVLLGSLTSCIETVLGFSSSFSVCVGWNAEGVCRWIQKVLVESQHRHLRFFVTHN